MTLWPRLPQAHAPGTFARAGSTVPHGLPAYGTPDHG